MDLAFCPANGDESTAFFVAGFAFGAVGDNNERWGVRFAEGTSVWLGQRIAINSPVLRAHASTLRTFATSWKPTHAPFGSV